MGNPALYPTAIRIFKKDLAKNLFSNNEFLLRSRDWSADAVGNQVVWSQSGASPNVIINNTTVPLTATNRADVQRSFALDEYQSIPTSVNITEELMVNYGMRQDILESHLGQIREHLADRIIYNWALAASQNQGIFKTTGASRPATAPGATGVRFAVTYADILKLQKKLVKDKVPYQVGKINLLVPADLLEEIMNLPEFKSREFFPMQNDTATPLQGAFMVGTIAGARVFVRDKVLISNNDATPVLQLPKVDNNASPRTPATTDCQGMLMWHEDYVVRAVSEASKINIIEGHGKTEFSITGIAGGNSMYSTGLGVAILVEG